MSGFPGNALVWSGRTDAEESGVTTRWHQHVQALAADSHGGVTLLGFAVDEGVRRNHGRCGAAQGPDALRAALAAIPVHGEPPVFDGGDIECPDGDLEAAQQRLAARVADALRRASLPLVLGGGHEVAWGSFQGLMAAGSGLDRLLIVNLDAHFDLRRAAHGNSGTPFLQIHDWCATHGAAFDYRVFGISRFANTRALFERAAELGVVWHEDEALQTEDGLRTACAALARDLQGCAAVYLTICLDVLPGAVAPGVSAPAPLGVPLARIEALIDTVLASGKLIAAEIAELNPAFDRDGLTARVAARIAARIARGAPCPV
ncbi:MAG: formimidoylglutamase [Rhodocyclaceae bacterium]|jgi:formiminoglutamase|nr:formimidoylglutamase [Rhodocyclaceae bacterium]MCL4758644.1 formimidoylglutamase [Rhodocyclaceae bacterium]